MTIDLIGIPHDRNSSFLKGPAAAPELIAKAIRSDSANMFCELGYDLGDPDLMRDCGSLPVSELEGRAAFEAIHDGVSDRLKAGSNVLSLGGDHSISYPTIMAHLDRYPRLSILHFDAHPDLYEDFEGNPFSHASPFARLMEDGRVQRLVQVGIRTINSHQREQAARYGVEQHEMRDLSCLRDIAFDGQVYVSIDLDALDPAYAPGVSHHEPGGLSTRQVIDLIHTVSGQVVGGDIVEYNPVHDINGMTAMVAAKLAKELAGRIIDCC
jgi:agmatinase